jgi:hypothetical protein
MADGEIYWSADVRVSMPMVPDQPVGVDMSGFVFTTGGMAHDITVEGYARLSTPDFRPQTFPNNVEYRDQDVDGPPATQEVF